MTDVKTLKDAAELADRVYTAFSRFENAATVAMNRVGNLLARVVDDLDEQVVNAGGTDEEPEEQINTELTNDEKYDFILNYYESAFGYSIRNYSGWRDRTCTENHLNSVYSFCKRHEAEQSGENNSNS